MNNKFINWSIFILLCIIWGSSFILMKVSKEGLTAAQVAALRIFSAGIILMPFAFFYIGKIPRKKIGLVILTGLFGNLIPAFLFTAAISKIDSSLAGVLNSLTPLCVVTIGIVFYRDKIITRKIAGVVIGFAGLVLLTLTQHAISLTNVGYSLLVVVATLSYGVNVNLVSHHLKEVKPLHGASVSLAFMTIPSGLVLWQQHFFQLDFTDAVTQWSVINAVLLGLVASALATALFYYLVQKASGLFASMVTYGVPFVALFWGFLDGETVTLKEIACLLLILLGVFLANFSTKKSSETKASLPE